MYFRTLPASLLALACALRSQVYAASDEVAEPCTVASASGAFYDLSPLSAVVVKDGVKPGKNVRTDDWHARGFDYKDNHANFTLNICAPIVNGTDEPFVGIEKNLARNVSASYELGSKKYSIGQSNSTLVLRGRRLVLQYTHGSPCGGESKKRSTWADDEFAAEEKDEDELKGSRRKSTIISFHCDKDPLATQAIATFVGTDPDECSYHFEILSTAACIGHEPAKQVVGPGAVFFIIGVIAILVYFLGGVFYQRNVAHARGWRQLPNYSMWAGIGSFIQVSGCNCLSRSKQKVFPRVAYVRDGVLPTMEVRTSSGGKWSQKSHMSRSSWDSTHLS